MGRGRRCPRTSSAKSAAASSAMQSCSPAAGVSHATRVPATLSSCSSDAPCQSARSLKRRMLSSRSKRFAPRRMRSVAVVQPRQRCQRPLITLQRRRFRRRIHCSIPVQDRRRCLRPRRPRRRHPATRAGSTMTWTSQPRLTIAERLVAAAPLLSDSSRRSRSRHRHQPASIPGCPLSRLLRGPPTRASPRALANARPAF